MTGRPSRWAGVAAVTLLVGALGAWEAGVAQASPPRHIDVTTTFDDLLPGETRTTTIPVGLDVDAHVSAVHLRPEGAIGAVRWSAQLCGGGPAPCYDLLAGRPGAEVGGGPHTFVVSVTALDLTPGQTSSLVGTVTLAESGTLALTDSPALPFTGGSAPTGGLPFTGAADVPALVATALAALSVGTLLVALARRRRAADRLARDEPC